MVVVHGIGSPKAGATSGGFATSIAKLLIAEVGDSNVAVEAQRLSGQTDVHANRVSWTSGRGTTQRRASILVTEVHWADVSHRPSRYTTWWWVLRNLPLLFLFPLAPGVGETLEWGRLTAILYRLVLPSLVIVCAASWHPFLLSGVLVGTLLAATSVRAFNLVGDVYMAATNEDQVAKITDRINATVDVLAARYDQVVVVGHSQGGYLAHRGLCQREASGSSILSLVGVGSGLKPIWLLKTFDSRRSIALAWLLLAGIFATFLGLVPIALAAVGQFRPFLRAWLPAAVGSLVNYTQGERPVSSSLARWEGVSSFTPDLRQSVLLGFGLIACIVALVVVRPTLEALSNRELSRPRAVASWREMISETDSVARLAYPRLNGAEISAWPVAGNSFRDHISYFGWTTPVMWQLAIQLFPQAFRRTAPSLASWTRFLDHRVQRSRRLASRLAMLILVAYDISRVDRDSHGLGLISVPSAHPMIVFAGIVAAVALPILLVDLARRRVIHAIRQRPIPSPDVVTRDPHRWIIGHWVWYGTGAVVLTSVSFPVPFAGMDWQDRLMVPITPYLLGSLLLVIGAALPSGYVPSGKHWLHILLSGSILCTFLPGNFIYATYVWVLLLCSVLLSVFNARQRSGGQTYSRAAGG